MIAVILMDAPPFTYRFEDCQGNHFVVVQQFALHAENACHVKFGLADPEFRPEAGGFRQEERRKGYLKEAAFIAEQLQIRAEPSGEYGVVFHIADKALDVAYVIARALETLQISNLEGMSNGLKKEMDQYFHRHPEAKESVLAAAVPAFPPLPHEAETSPAALQPICRLTGLPEKPEATSHAGRVESARAASRSAVTGQGGITG